VRPPEPDTESPAEERVVDLLGALRRDPPPVAPGLPATVVHAVRWQRAVRGALQVTGLMASAAADVVAMLVRPTPKERDR
jgi:hypothetical protein